MGNYKFDSVDDLYQQIGFDIYTGATFEISMDCDKNIDDLNSQIIESLISAWTFPYNGKYIKPFKLLNFTMDETSFHFTIKLKMKRKDVDELKLFFQDLLDFLNLDHIQISKINIEII